MAGCELRSLKAGKRRTGRGLALRGGAHLPGCRQGFRIRGRKAWDLRLKGLRHLCERGQVAAYSKCLSLPVCGVGDPSLIWRR